MKVLPQDRQRTYNATSWRVRVTTVAIICFLFIVVGVHAAVDNMKCSELPWKYSNAFPLLWCRATKYFVLLVTIKMYLGLHAKYPIFLSEFYQMRSVSTDIRKVLKIQVQTHENPFSGTRADACGQGKGHTHFSRLLWTHINRFDIW